MRLKKTWDAKLVIVISLLVLCSCTTKDNFNPENAEIVGEQEATLTLPPNVPPPIDRGYLKHWSGDLELGLDAGEIKNSPVINVSWFAARAFAKWKGKRLPTLDEWEYVASASGHKPLASRDKEFVQQILDWYSKPNPETLPPVAQNNPNYYGVYDLHGLVWEWVQNFNTVFISGESRGNQGELKQFYCAAGSSAASDADKENYAAFLRYAFRGSLEADFSVGNLGFRLAKDIKE